MLIAMAIYEIATMFPLYLSVRLIPATSSLTNKSIVVYDWQNYDVATGVLAILLNFSIPTFICFILVTMGTIFLAIKLRQSAEFRKSMSVKKTDKISTRERKVSRSVIGVCVIYIVCQSPNVFIYLASIIYPPFASFDPVYGNLVLLILFVCILFQAISSSINLFVYLQMMSQYRETFKKLFLACRASTNATVQGSRGS